MKRGLIWCSVGVVLLASTVWSQSGGTEKAVADLEQQWLKSQQTNNPDLIAPHLADKIVATQSDGKVYDKAAAVELAKKTKYTSALLSTSTSSLYRNHSAVW